MREGRDPPGVCQWGFSYRDGAVLAPWSVDLLVARLRDAAPDHAPRLGGIDDVVDHRPAGADVRTDLLADRLAHLRPCLLGVVGGFDLLVEDDVHRSLGS